MNLVTQIQNYMTDLLIYLEESVNMDSPSTDKALNDRMIDWYAALFLKLTNGRVERVSNEEFGDRLVCSVGPEQGANKRILILGHCDTVWPVGEAVRRPFAIEGNHAYGPGVYDMKAGLLQAMYAIKALMDLGRMPQDTEIVLLINSDEEIGSRTSRAHIEQEAMKSDAVLVLEPPMEPTGALKTWRKGSGSFKLKVEGRSAHAGVNPELGVSAIKELAEQIGQLYELEDLSLGTTLNVGIVQGGIAYNVVAAEAEAIIDVRVATMEEAARIERAMLEKKNNHPEAVVTVTGGIRRPPMERTSKIETLYKLAEQVASEELPELILQEAGTGGVSDGNFTAACGIPTLDGLGASGDFAHSPKEYVRIDQIPQRTALLAGLIERI
ncbi:M20 family peptidase [Paenibacillus albiflavus]|uniref:M20 family peptidase n=1 Tax=Paenibacillus albiflavus TaxID=2545760 RepID=A0A4R4EGJ8_9BACL|nr:M20 family metallopeptidase [Paenibacillus albiflavus]TCZ77268.1 M20 family peptidase [Paenibacillus albiflavus]